MLRFTQLTLFCLAAILLWGGFKPKKKTKVKKTDLVQLISMDRLETMINTQSDSILIINFWATWCKPCVDELPEFEKITAKYKDKKVKVILVSLDYPRHLEQRVIPFVTKNNLQSEVYLLDEKDPAQWLERISAEWMGSIPATMVVYYPDQVKDFYEKELNFSELQKIINQTTRFK